MYNLNATFDLHLGFRGLTPGSYIYRIEATDLRGFSQTVIEKAFSIVEKDAAASDIHVYGATYHIPFKSKEALRYDKRVE